MAKKTVADVAKAKAEKQKKMVIGLSVFLVLALAYGVHTMMSLQSGGAASSKPQVSATPTAAGAATTPAAVPSTDPSALPAAPTLSAADPTATTSSSSSLIDAVKPPAESGQLQSFSLFASKDPFNAGGPGSSSGHSSGSSSGSSKGSSGSGPSTPPATPPAPPTAPPTSAVIAVNGVSETVANGAGFPAASPMFDLLSLTASSAKVSVIGGSYASGSASLSLRVGKPVTLVNTADGTRYTLELLPQGTVPTSSGAGASGGATTTPTTTTP
jgi:hypothetical protein